MCRVGIEYNNWEHLDEIKNQTIELSTRLICHLYLDTHFSEEDMSRWFDCNGMNEYNKAKQDGGTDHIETHFGWLLNENGT